MSSPRLTGDFPATVPEFDRLPVAPKVDPAPPPPK